MKAAYLEFVALFLSTCLLVGCQSVRGPREDIPSSRSTIRDWVKKRGEYWGVDERARAIERRLESKEFTTH